MRLPTSEEKVISELEELIHFAKVTRHHFPDDWREMMLDAVGVIMERILTELDPPPPSC